MDESTLPSFDNAQKFGTDKMAVTGGRALPSANPGTPSDDGKSFSQSKLEDIGGRNLPKPQQGASTLEVNDIGNVDKLGAFPN